MTWVRDLTLIPLFFFFIIFLSCMFVSQACCLQYHKSISCAFHVVSRVILGDADAWMHLRGDVIAGIIIIEHEKGSSRREKNDDDHFCSNRRGDKLNNVINIFLSCFPVANLLMSFDLSVCSVSVCVGLQQLFLQNDSSSKSSSFQSSKLWWWQRRERPLPLESLKRTRTGFYSCCLSWIHDPSALSFSPWFIFSWPFEKSILSK